MGTSLRFSVRFWAVTTIVSIVCILLSLVSEKAVPEKEKIEVIKKVLSFAIDQNKKRVLVAMQSPYDIRELVEQAEGAELQ